MSFADQLMTIYSELKVTALSKSSGYAEAEDLLHDTLIRSIEIQDKYTKEIILNAATMTSCKVNSDSESCE